MAKQKHFGVSRVIQPDDPTAPIEQVKIEAVFSKAVQVIAWRDLQDDSVWRQGWVGLGLQPPSPGFTLLAVRA